MRKVMIYVDNDFIWVATNHLVAISRKNPKQQKILASFDRGSQCISGDSSGNIWVGTWNGLYKISANREMTRYINSSDKGELSVIRFDVYWKMTSNIYG